MVGIPTSLLVPALIAFLTVALGTISMVLLLEWLQEQKRKRQMVDQLRSLANEPVDRVGTPVFRSAVLQSAWLRPIITRIPQFRDAELILQQAGITWSLQTLLLLSLGTAVGLGLTVFILSGSVLVGVVATIVGAILPNLYSDSDAPSVSMHSRSCCLRRSTS